MDSQRWSRIKEIFDEARELAPGTRRVARVVTEGVAAMARRAVRREEHARAT